MTTTLNRKSRRTNQAAILPKEEREILNSESSGGWGGVNPLATYLSEARGHKLLTAGEEQKLGAQVELQRYLLKLKQELSSDYQNWISDKDLTVYLLQRFGMLRRLFEVLCTHLGIDDDMLLARINNNQLHDSINGYVNPELVAAVARKSDLEAQKALDSIMELSRVMRLICWPVVEKVTRLEPADAFYADLEARRFFDSLERYPSELLAHFNSIREQGRDAVDNLVVTSLRLVVSIAYRFANRGVALPDLIQEGNLGLIRAAQKFEHRRNNRFSTYAVWWIRQLIHRAVPEQSQTIHLPLNVSEGIGKMIHSNYRLSQQFGRQPTVQELADDMGLPTGKVEMLISAQSYQPVSLDTPVGEEEDMLLSDCIEDKNCPAPDEEVAGNFLCEGIQELLETLPEMERRVIELKFGFSDGVSHSQAAVARETGLNPNRVHLLETSALRKLRASGRVEALKDLIS
jgi:RNA polymerase primary sigma factor